jgi:hypothetical protein
MVTPDTIATLKPSVPDYTHMLCVAFATGVTFGTALQPLKREFSNIYINITVSHLECEHQFDPCITGYRWCKTVALKSIADQGVTLECTIDTESSNAPRVTMRLGGSTNHAFRRLRSELGPIGRGVTW